MDSMYSTGIRVSKSRKVALLCAGENVINYKGKVHLFW
jgi:hypothetical protein